MSFVPWYAPGGAQGNLYPRHPWDQISLGGGVIPCHKAKITGASLAMLRDRKKQLGANGGRPTYHGIDPRTLDVDVEFTTVEQLREFADVMAPLFPSDKHKPDPVPIDAQQLQHLAVLATVVLVEVGAIEGEAIKRCRLRFDHWLKPAAVAKAAEHTPKKPIGNAVLEAAAAKENPKPSAQAGFCSAPSASTG